MTYSQTPPTSWTSQPIEITATRLRIFSATMGAATGYGTVPGRSSYHDDPETARSLGYRATVAWGLHTYALIVSLVERTFGPTALTATTIDVEFVKPVYEGDVIVVNLDRTEPTDRTQAREHVALRVRAENAAGNIVARGHITVPMTSTR